MRWLSIDPAKLTGVARWDGDRLVSVATVRAATPKERKLCKLPASALAVDTLEAGTVERRCTFPATEVTCWDDELRGMGALVAEEGFGASAKTVKQHAFRRGFVAALCAERLIAFYEVNVSEWRKVVGAANGFTFPRRSEDAKERAQELVLARFGQRVSDDEADAVCAGLWALETRTVRP